MAQSETTREQFQAAIVALAPVVVLAGFALHPYIGAGLPDQTAVAVAATDHTTRWGLAHVTVGIGSGLLVLAFLAIRARLRETGPERWSARGVPLIVVGSAVYTLLPGMEMAPLAAAEAGVDVESVAEALVPWFVPLHVLGALAFGAGVVAFARGIADSGILGGALCRIVVGALGVTAIARLVPLTTVQFYVQGAAGVVALWPLALVMWKAPVRHPAPGATVRPGDGIRLTAGS
jgi:hypothetical protein